MNCYKTNSFFVIHNGFNNNYNVEYDIFYCDLYEQSNNNYSNYSYKYNNMCIYILLEFIKKKKLHNGC